MQPEAQANELDIKALLAPLKGKRNFLLTCAIATGAIFLIYTLVVPPQWKADTTILTVLPSDDMAGGGAGASLASALSPNAPDPIQVLEGVLTSRKSINLIMERTHLARRDLEKGLKTERRQKQALLTISWEDSDRKRALAVVQGAVDGVLLIQHDVEFTTAGLQAKYYEQSVKDQDEKLRDAEKSLAEFEKRMKAPIDPSNPASAGAYLKEKKDLELQLGAIDAQIAVARSQAQLLPKMPELPTLIPSTKPYRDKLISLEYDLQVAETTLGPMAPKVVALKRTIEVTRETLNQEIRSYLKSVAVNLDPTIATLAANRLTIKYQLDVVNDLAARAPDEALILARLSREVVILGTISTALRSKYEQAKVAAKVDQVRWAVLEDPFIEDLPTNKHVARNPFMGGFLGLVFGSFFLIWKSKRAEKKQSRKGLDGISSS